jgi:hypothetical protein
MSTKEEIEAYATIMAQPDFQIMRDGAPTARTQALIGHLYIEDQVKAVQRSAEIAREIAETSLDMADRLNEEMRVATFGRTPDL